MLLSIIIPTKNRYEYLSHCISSILDVYADQDIEIIIQDNSTDDMPKEIVKLISSNHVIKYSKVDGWISVIENFELAIGLAEGEFITMLGDDDGLSSYLIDAVNYMKRNNIDALNTPFAHYLWPDVESRVFKKGLSGVLNINKYDSSVKRLDQNKEYQKMLHIGGTKLLNLPRMYYGILKRELLLKVQTASGAYLPGPSPDMANAVSVGLYVEKLYHVDFPLFIAGNSSKSTAGMGAKGTHVGVLEEISFLPKNCAKNWSALVPRFWSGATIWAESSIKAMEACVGMVDERFNYIRLYASALVFSPMWADETYNTLNKFIEIKQQNKVVVYVKLWVFISFIWFDRGIMLLRNILKMIKNKNNEKVKIENVNLATKILNSNLSKAQNPFHS